MTATQHVLQVWLAAFVLLPIIGWGGYLVGLIVVDTVQRGRAAAHAGRSWDCRTVECRTGGVCDWHAA